MQFPSNPGGSFPEVRHVSLGIAPAAYRAGSELRTTAQSAATAAWCRSERESEQFSPTPVAPGRAEEKKRPQPAVPDAGRSSKEEWEQVGPTPVERDNAAVKTESSGNKRPQTEGSGSKRHVAPGLGDRHFVPPRRSVLQPDGVTLAARASRSVAVQTGDSVHESFSLWDWLTPRTLDGGRSPHQRRSFQGRHWTELRKVQHDIPQTSEGTPLDLTLRRRCWSRRMSASRASLRTCTS